MSLQELKQECKAALSNQYDSIELNSLMAILFEHITGWDKLKQVLNKETELSQEKIKEFHEALNLLREGMPIQYIIGKAWFMGNEFIVNENVLIPRPETEELVEWIIEYATIINKPLQILDIGTGSGCIPIALKLALPHCMLAGLDISEKALLTAKQNADTLKTKISWIQEDILNTTYLLNQFDVIVSNPPLVE